MFYPPRAWPPEAALRRVGPMYDGVIGYWVGHGDMIENLIDRVERTLQVGSPAAPFLREVLERWEEERTFQRLREQNAGGPRFSFIDGPITANNPMGVHHAWGRTYKDLYQRYHTMLGERQRYQNGFDCQGLWIEVEVERQLGFNNKRQIEELYERLEAVGG